MPKFVVLTEGFAGTTYELTAERTTVGRLEDNTWQLAEPSVSGHHCEILLRANDIVVRDLNSTNGTFINGVATREGVLKPGQVLRLGQVEIRVENGAPPPLSSKKTLGHTLPISGGVKLDELDQGNRALTSPFAKKSDKASKVILYLGLVLGAIIILLIIYAILQL
ncbi:MAG: FHA domain-containing protein [Verrucomicrobia bacterium]|nr:FHA domain-containing protein [Verrucomicrobiota bacterium]